MKKVLFVLAAFALATAGAFAAAPEAALSVSLSGEASFTIGFDIDNGDVGIKNAASGDITVTLVSEGTDEKGGEGVYGWIKLENFKVALDDDDSLVIKPYGDIYGKLYIDAIYIDITGADNKTDAASLSYAGTVLSGTNAVVVNPTEEYKGIAIGLKDDTMVKFVAGVASEYSYDNATNQNANWNAYLSVGIGSKIVEGVSFDVKANYSTVANAPIGLGVSAGYAAGAIAAGVGFDVSVATANAMEASVKLQYILAGSATKFTLAGGAEVEYKPGVAASAIFDITGEDLDAAVTFFDADAIKDVNVVAVVEAMDVLSALDLGIGLLASVSIPDSKIAAGFSLTYKDLSEATEAVTKAKVWADYTGITNTTLTLAYTSGDLTAATAVLGKVEFTTKVAY